MLMMLLVLISNVKPEDCKCCRRLLLVDITQERCDLEVGKVWKFVTDLKSAPGWWSRHQKSRWGRLWRLWGQSLGWRRPPSWSRPCWPSWGWWGRWGSRRGEPAWGPRSLLGPGLSYEKTFWAIPLQGNVNQGLCSWGGTGWRGTLWLCFGSMRDSHLKALDS